MSNYTVASYNLLHEQAAETYKAELPPQLQTKTSWSAREPYAIQNVHQLQADILCVQECTREMYKNMGMQEAIYAFHKDPHNPRLKHYHGVAILYNPARFSLIQGSLKTIYSQNGKASVVVDLQDKTTQKVIRVVSMHLDGGPNRNLGDTQLEDVHNKLAGRPDQPDYTILAGDFNEGNQGHRIQYLHANGMVVASSQNPTEPHKQRTIDWIAVSNPAKISPENTARLSNLASDHMPALVTVTEMPTPPVFNKPTLQELQAMLPSQTRCRIDADGCTTLEKHILAKQDFDAVLQQNGYQYGSVTYETADAFSRLPLGANHPLNPVMFYWSATAGVQHDIPRVAAQQDCIHVFQVASQANATESPNVFTPSPGEAMPVSEDDHTQGPFAQRTNPHFFELINAHLANGGYCMFANVLPADLLSSVHHGYFMPTVAQLPRAVEAFAHQRGKLEQPCLRSNLGNGSVYLMLSAAPAIGYSPALYQVSTADLQFYVAFANYSAQFGKILSLAKENPNKTIVYHPCAVGLGVFGNDPECVGKAFQMAARTFQDECKRLGLSNIKVQFEVYGGTETNALKMAQTAGLQQCGRFGEPKS